MRKAIKPGYHGTGSAFNARAASIAIDGRRQDRSENGKKNESKGPRGEAKQAWRTQREQQDCKQGGSREALARALRALAGRLELGERRSRHGFLSGCSSEGLWLENIVILHASKGSQLLKSRILHGCKASRALKQRILHGFRGFHALKARILLVLKGPRALKAVFCVF